eukprot:Em0011g417a
MIVTVKTLQQKLFKVEISESETCLALKEKIEAEQGPSFPAAALKLIYAGKILNDSSPLSEYNISENSFVVVMVTKTAAASKPAAAPAKAPETAPTPATQPQAAATQQQQTAATPQQSTTPTPAAPSVSTSVGVSSTDSGSSDSANLDWRQASSVLVTGADYERVVANLMAMGFDRESVVRALEASYNNPDRAVEYLMSGVPEGFGEVEEPEEMAPIPQPAPQPVRGPVVAPGQQPPAPQPAPQPVQGEGNPLEFLRQLPQFNMLRQVVQQNPSMLQALLQQIGQSNPRLLQIISQNQEAFVSLLNEPIPGQPAAGGRRPGVAGIPAGGVPGAPAGGPGVGEAGGEGGVAGYGGGPGLPPGTMSIQVSPEEKEAIDRLKALGFREHLVIQAYFACDKNEELAANFLLQQDPEDD